MGGIHHRQDGDTLQQLLGFSTPVGFNNARQNIHTFAQLLLSRLQHGVCLACTRASAKENLKAATLGLRFFRLYHAKQGIRVGSAIGIVHMRLQFAIQIKVEH